MNVAQHKAVWTVMVMFGVATVHAAEWPDLVRELTGRDQGLVVVPYATDLQGALPVTEAGYVALVLTDDDLLPTLRQQAHDKIGRDLYIQVAKAGHIPLADNYSLEQR